MLQLTKIFLGLNRLMLGLKTALAVLMLISLTDSAVLISNFGTLYNRKELFGHFSKDTNL